MKITWDGWSEPVEEVVLLGPPKEQVTREVSEFKEAAAEAGQEVSEALRAQREPRAIAIE